MTFFSCLSTVCFSADHPHEACIDMLPYVGMMAAERV